MGCFADSSDSRDLPVNKGSYSNMTVSFCYSLCTGYNYFALQA